jgi:hypothetical protein
MILEDEYRTYLSGWDLAPSTLSTEIAALRRIERSEGVDLEAEVARDSLASLINRYRYSIEDERIGSPNPTKIPIEPDNLRRDVGWYRTQLERYLRFRRMNSLDVNLPAERGEGVAHTDIPNAGSQDEAEVFLNLKLICNANSDGTLRSLSQTLR